MLQKKMLNSHWQQILHVATWPWFFLFLAFTIWNYQLGLRDLPSRDQLMFLDEKIFFATDWDFFLHSLGFSRGRLLFAGDYFLFRPGHFFILGLNQLVTGGDVLLSGLFTYPLVAFTALSLFLVGRQLVSPLLAIAAALLWIDLFPGVFTVVWRHINPYLLSCAFLGIGLAQLISAQRQQQPWPLSATFYLFLASLFHEMVLFSLAAVFLWLTLAFRKSPVGPAASRAISLHKRVISPALLGNLFLNLLDLITHPLPTLFGMDDLLHTNDFLETLLAVIVGLPGAATASLGLPFLIQKFTVGNWPFMALEANRWLVVTVGFLLVPALVFVVFSAFKHLAKGETTPRTLTVALLMPFFWGIVLIWGGGRAFSRGVIYLYESPHYYLMLDWLLLLTVLAYLGAPNQQSTMPGRQRWALALVLLVLPFHHLRLQSLLAEQYPRAWARTNAYQAFANALTPLSARYCLTGKGYSPDARPYLLEHSDSGDITLLLRTFFCREQDSRLASQLIYHQGTWWLAKVSTAPLPRDWHWQKVALATTATDRWQTDDRNRTSESPHPNNLRLGSFLTSDESRSAPSLSITLSLPYRGGIVFGVQDFDNYDLLRIHEHRLVFFRYRQGKAIRAESFENHLPPAALTSVRLEMFYRGEDLWLFVNGFYYTTIVAIPPVNGRIGLFSPVGGLGKQQYSDFKYGPPLSEETPPLVMEPVAPLWQPGGLSGPEK